MPNRTLSSASVYAFARPTYIFQFCVRHQRPSLGLITQRAAGSSLSALLPRNMVKIRAKRSLIAPAISGWCAAATCTIIQLAAVQIIVLLTHAALPEHLNQKAAAGVHVRFVRGERCAPTCLHYAKERRSLRSGPVFRPLLMMPPPPN